MKVKIFISAILFFILTSINFKSSAQCAGFNFTTTQIGLTATFAPNIPANYLPISYNWDFGDGGTDTAPLAIHTYNTAGIYYVCLTVTMFDPNFAIVNCTYCDSIVVGNVNQNLCNAVNFTKTINGLTVNFTSNLPAGFNNPVYNWSFGDGSSSTLANPSHTYNQSGMYYVCMVVSGYDNQQQPITCTYCDSVSVNNANQNLCNAVNFTKTINGLTVNFTSSLPAGFNNPVYNWTFGDGSNSTLANPSHTYNQSGMYYVCMAVSGYDNQQQPITCTYCDSLTLVTSSVSNIDESPILKIYPNPTKGDIEIDLPETEMLYFKLYDVMGKLILTEKINNQTNKFHLNLNHLSKGSYYLLLKSSNGKNYHSTFIKQ